jgi:LuxR family maltose regulon positive regulatory protein
MGLDSPLLATKLFVPRLRRNRVPRPRLVARLSQGLAGKLTLVSAPAGFGKTTLISEWLQQVDRPFTWLSLDESDNDPTRFLTYLGAALQRINTGWGQIVEAVLHVPRPPPPQTVVATLINEIAAAGAGFVLALDDYHLISAQPVHDVLAFVLDNMPPQMHLVVLTRADPPLPLARLRASGELTEIRADDLRFTADEAAAFLSQVMKLNLTAEQMATLEARTEGWVVGLQLAALSLQSLGHDGDVAAFIEAFAGSHRYVMDYLIEEVLSRQASHVQEFLLQTSILDRLCGSLCDALTGHANGQAMLERLDRSNLFTTPLDHERRWYRYHQLFADLLRDRLRRTQPERVPELHRWASEWYEHEEMTAEAFRHALAAEEMERAARLAEESAGEMIRRGEMATLLRWLGALPDKMVRSRARMSIDYAWGLLLTGQVSAVESRLRDAERILAQWEASPPAVSEEPGIRELHWNVRVIRLFVDRFKGDSLRTIEVARQALEQLDEEHTFGRGLIYLSLGAALREMGDVPSAVEAYSQAAALCHVAKNTVAAMIATFHLTRLYIVQGRLRYAAENCREVLRTTEQCAASGIRRSSAWGMAYLAMADVLYEWNELAAAEQHVQTALALGEPGGYQGLLTNGYTLLVRIRQACGDVQGAHEAIHELEQGIQKGNLLQTIVEEMAAYRAWFWLMEGNLGAAGRWAKTIEPSPDDKLDTLREFQWITLVRVLLAQGRPDEAGSLLEQLLHTAEAEGRMGKAIEILALQALARQACGDTSGALAALKRALVLGEPEGYVRSFVDEGTPMATLLHRALLQGIVPHYVSRLLAAFEEPAVAQPLAEPLTPRELEVLRLIAAGLKNQEIAGQLFISVATVKRHITNIYGKLDVSHRTQAITRAQVLDLV